jgi:hypothetical protein
MIDVKLLLPFDSDRAFSNIISFVALCLTRSQEERDYFLPLFFFAPLPPGAPLAVILDVDINSPIYLRPVSNQSHGQRKANDVNLRLEESILALEPVMFRLDRLDSIDEGHERRLEVSSLGLDERARLSRHSCGAIAVSAWRHGSSILWRKGASRGRS